LIGTWVVDFAGESRTDTLKIHEDGTYRQLFINSNINYRYESPWYKWWLEDKPTGEKYLHLENMLFCGGGEEKCGDPKTKDSFYDFCEDKWLEMDGEFVLAVIGDENANKGIGLQVFKPLGSEFYSAIYTLQNINDGN
jgi:hypothetical protein